LTLLAGQQEGHAACKTEWWDAGVVMCLDQEADLHMPADATATLSCFSKIQIGFTFLVLPLWYLLTRVVLDRIQESRKMVVCVSVCVSIINSRSTVAIQL